MFAHRHLFYRDAAARSAYPLVLADACEDGGEGEGEGEVEVMRSETADEVIARKFQEAQAKGDVISIDGEDVDADGGGADGSNGSDGAGGGGGADGADESGKSSASSSGGRNGGPSGIVSDKLFKKRFDHFSKGSFNGIDWSNMVVAGGSVTACAMAHDDAKFKEVLSSAYKDSDIDVFLFGLTPTEANAKLRHVYELLFNPY